MAESKRLSLEVIEALATEVLLKHGFSADQAGAIAENVTVAERDGCVSHGLFRIPFYVRTLKSPASNPVAVPTLRVTDSSVVHVDSHGGFCPLSLRIGEPALLEKARKHGIAALAIHQAINIAALWPEVERLAESGLVVFAFTAANAYVAPAGGIKPIYGTNPMAFGFPRKGSPPLVFDQASSASARGEIQLHLREGKPLPEGWAIDKDGNPTTDPAAALEGAQLPFGGHKGASLALMVELLAGALIGDAFSVEASANDTHGAGISPGGELILAIDPSHCSGSTDHLARSEYLFQEILNQPGTRLPSQRRYKVRQQHIAEGVDVSLAMLNELEQLKNDIV
ncbi:Ldh family oxidoreductase [Granulosicoccus antarcticus]|uniref:Delta(1)-pyrroline-2-carboxylate/Delta(1)-piperideine-2-carboxylate reductase n=1 Tax=Granulosicoccus antarcticus IMCC3135 TaxID=1192854 RepID=A0A2Z2P7I8_9GAMM|nr:Ldh family oxidoreductase [Granulosicoccus antarcticus]ASJ76657.1 Delta(1)-pyrroline-2-carboxylate/Delta(1)-piperideine-2-carboxylate reductase [Granulosicoccus antarcticus IMCC3135]